MNFYPQSSFNQYGMMQPNYQMQYQPQQMQQVQTQQNLPCRYTNDFNSLTANEIPMDGNYAVFLKNDMSEVQLKKWNANGGIDTLIFAPKIIEPEKAVEKAPSELETLNNRIINLENSLVARLDELESSLLSKVNQPRQKKEVVNV